MTYSIVARDDATGQLGVAVQTCMFAVGSIVPWVRPGVGAVATQAFAEAAYGPRCLDALAGGSSAADALAAAQEADAMAVMRQVGVVSADGTAAATTGDMCIDHAGHIIGDGFTVQANMMSTPAVWGVMASAYEKASGPLARRLFAALVAAEETGGDARGRMSAAVVVMGDGPIVDVRVDYSDNPLGELSTLLDAADAFAGLNRAVDELLGGDPSAALATLDEALVLLPDEGNMRNLRAGALLASGAIDEGVAELRALVSAHPNWEVVVRGFAAKGLVTLPEGVSIDALLG